MDTERVRVEQQWMDTAAWKEQVAESDQTNSRRIGLRKTTTDAVTSLVGPDTERTVTFVVSNESIDRDKDSLSAKGWELDHYQTNPVVLFAHDYKALPIAKALSIHEENGQLVSTAQFATAEENPFADMVYRLLKGGYLNAVSVGFVPKEYTQNKERGGYDFTKQELLEYSVVPVPANAGALIQARGVGIDVTPLQTWAEGVIKGLSVKSECDTTAYAHQVTESLTQAQTSSVVDEYFVPPAADPTKRSVTSDHTTPLVEKSQEESVFGMNGLNNTLQALNDKLTVEVQQLRESMTALEQRVHDTTSSEPTPPSENQPVEEQPNPDPSERLLLVCQELVVRGFTVILNEQDVPPPAVAVKGFEEWTDDHLFDYAYRHLDTDMKLEINDWCYSYPIQPLDSTATPKTDEDLNSIMLEHQHRSKEPQHSSEVSQELPLSFEAVTRSLEKNATRFLTAYGHHCQDTDIPLVVATFANHAWIAVAQQNQGESHRVYQGQWERHPDTGLAEWKGEPEPVQAVVTSDRIKTLLEARRSQARILSVSQDVDESDSPTMDSVTFDDGSTISLDRIVPVFQDMMKNRTTATIRQLQGKLD